MVLPVDAHGRMAAVERQIDSIRDLAIATDVLRITGRRRLKYVGSLPDLLRRSRRVDLIHAHYGYAGWFARMNVRRPLVVSFMGSDLLGIARENGSRSAASRWIVGLDRLLARIADRVIVKSPEMARVIPRVKTHVIPNGVDLERFAPCDRESARRDLGWTRGRKILFPGCVHEARKGIALARATSERVAELLGEPVELVPLCDVPGDRVPTYLNGSDALLMTSYWEGSPNAVKEAMACDLPVVSVPVGDVPELLDGSTGNALCPRDADQLAHSLAAILAAGHPSTGREALRRKGLDLETVARRVRTVYVDVLEARGGGG
jgi:glycosyltransferase involved in cell wall biosynthesis